MGQPLQWEWLPVVVSAFRATRWSVGTVSTCPNEHNGIPDLPLLVGSSCRRSCFALPQLVAESRVLIAKRLKGIMKLHELHRFLCALSPSLEVVEDAFRRSDGLGDRQPIGYVHGC